MHKPLLGSNLELPRGMKDFDDDELFKIDYVKQKFTETAKLFGYRFMDPSPIELFSVLETKSGPAIKDDIYYFRDKHDREVGLRFDFTMGLTRWVVSQKSLKLPAKLASFGGVFRYDEPQKARYRFFHQWNIEIFGKSSLAADAELVEFTSRFFEKLNLKNIVIDINHRKLVEFFVKKTISTIIPSVNEQDISDAFRLLDKVQKKSETKLVEEYKERFSQPLIHQLIEFASLKGNPHEIEQKFSEIKEFQNWDELKELYFSLEERDVENISINFGIVRGLDYYSDFVFEAFDTSLDIGALVGGGRYDSLPKAFGRDDLGATGVAGGVERIILSLDKQGLVPPRQSQLISVLYATSEMQEEATNLASQLRSEGISVVIDLAGRPLKKQIESATNSKYAIIVGSKEFSEDKVVLRNMQDRTEKQILVDDLIANSKSILS